ncbi:MAG TPA: hypothetical protein VMS76_06550 [Planctomycetota bacterium]|nr:hypothetical protein [Planctomycetota bacterium]
MAKAKSKRFASVYVHKGPNITTLQVTVPHKPTAKELAVLQSSIAEKIIKDLTGCSCLSGAIEMIFRDEFADSIRVDMSTGALH